MSKTISINISKAQTAIKAEAARVGATLTASGGDTWDTGNGSENRSFSVTVSK